MVYFETFESLAGWVQTMRGSFVYVRKETNLLPWGWLRGHWALPWMRVRIPASLADVSGDNKLWMPGWNIACEPGRRQSEGQLCHDVGEYASRASMLVWAVSGFSIENPGSRAARYTPSVPCVTPLAQGKSSLHCVVTPVSAFVIQWALRDASLRPRVAVVRMRASTPLVRWSQATACTPTKVKVRIGMLCSKLWNPNHQ